MIADLAIVMALALGAPPVSKTALLAPPEDLDHCEKDSDCVLVPFKPCCGPEVRPIHKKWKAVYLKSTPLQAEPESTCAVVGICAQGAYPERFRVEGVSCHKKRCVIRGKGYDDLLSP